MGGGEHKERLEHVFLFEKKKGDLYERRRQPTCTISRYLIQRFQEAGLF